jgi:GTPase SAR1 family protein
MLSFSEDENSENIKIILLGESGVGKTSIIKCFNDEIFKSWYSIFYLIKKGLSLILRK